MKKIYQKSFKFIKNIPRNLFYVLGGSPSVYWGWLLLFSGALFIGIIAFGIYFFVSTNNKIFAEVILPEERRPLAVDRDELSRALEILDQREKDYASAITAPLIADPSL